MLEQLQLSLGERYTIEKELGGGGMSRVFLATENRLNRRVVVKVLAPELAAGVNADRFEREIQLAARLQQANIVPLLSTGEIDGLPYFTMPFVDGESLRARLKGKARLPISECLDILRDVARALSYAHASGVVHRDIKPDNVLLSHGAAMVTDFGIAKAISASRDSHSGSELTQTGTSLGSPAYMAPEQIAGDPNVDHRADLYAFGCLAYELLTGRPPFSGEIPQRVLAAHLTEKSKPIESVAPEIPSDLASIVEMCLEKDPQDRPQSAADVLSSLGLVSSTGGGRRSPLSSGTRRQKKNRVLAVIGALVVISLTAYVASSYGGRSVAPTDKSIAVLPLANLSGDKSNDFFGEGLAEEITGALTRAGLHVIGRSSALTLANKGLGAAEIARQLHVSNVLQGSVQRSGDQVRITVSLVSMPDQTVLWSERYDRGMKDVFAMQDEIARAVASELRVKLSGVKLARTETEDPEAHTAFLQGLYLWNRRTAPGLRKAISLFSDAVRRDPSYAQAYGGLAMAYVVLPAYDDSAGSDALERAREAANRALALDSANVLALTALGYTDALEYRNESAHRLFARAIAADSAFATAHFWRALLLLQQERLDEALAEVHRARALEPASLVINTAVVQVLYDMRKYDEAEKAGRSLLQLDSTFQLGIIDLAKVLIERGRSDEAIAMMLPTMKVPGVSHIEKSGVVAYAMAKAGRVSDARRYLDSTVVVADRGVARRGMVAAALDAIGERERAIAMLRLAVEDHDLWLAHYIPAAPYDGLRKEPRVGDLFAKVSAR